jgi:hypothetical protein
MPPKELPSPDELALPSPEQLEEKATVGAHPHMGTLRQIANSTVGLSLLGKAFLHSKEDLEAQRHAARNMVNTFTLGYEPEIEAAAKKVGSWISGKPVNYENAKLDTIRDMMNDQAKYPVAGAGGGLVGGGALAGTMALAPAALVIRSALGRAAGGLGVYAGLNAIKNPGAGQGAQLDERMSNVAEAMNPVKHPVAIATSALLPAMFGDADALQQAAYKKKFDAFSPKTAENRAYTEAQKMNAGRVMLEEGEGNPWYLGGKYLTSRAHMEDQAKQISDNVGKSLDAEMSSLTDPEIPAQGVLDDVNQSVSEEVKHVPGHEDKVPGVIGGYFNKKAEELGQQVDTGDTFVSHPARSESYTETGPYGEEINRTRDVPATNEVMPGSETNFSRNDLWNIRKGIDRLINWNRQAKDATEPEAGWRAARGVVSDHMTEGLPEGSPVLDLNRRYAGSQTAEDVLHSAGVRDKSRMNVGLVEGLAGTASALEDAREGHSKTHSLLTGILGAAAAKGARMYGNNIQAQGLYDMSNAVSRMPGLPGAAGQLPGILTDAQIKDDFQKRAK